MNSESVGRLAKTFDFARWSQPQDTQDGSPFVWRFAPAGTELAGWRLHRVERSGAAWRPVPPAADAPAGPDTPGTHSLWLDGTERGGSMLRVDTYECASRADARARLLALLGEHQGAALFTEARDAAGEVAFVAPGGHARLFVRGNLVVQVRNASRQLTDVGAPARAFDGLLLARPDPGQAEAMGMHSAEMAPEALAALGEQVEAAAEDPDLRSVWFKFFARGGEVVRQGGRPVFRPRADAGAAPPQITVYAVGMPRARTELYRVFGFGI